MIIIRKILFKDIDDRLNFEIELFRTYGTPIISGKLLFYKYLVPLAPIYVPLGTKYL